MVDSGDEEWLERLVEAIRSGSPLDLSVEAPEHQRIPAMAIRSALLQQVPEADPRGLTVIAGWVVETLNLDYSRIPYPLRLIGCSLDGGISGREAQLGTLALAACRAGPIVVDDAQIDGHLQLSRTTTSLLTARRATIRGVLGLSGSTLYGQAGTALNLDGADIKGALFATDGVSATGEVRALYMTVGGPVALSGSTFRNPVGNAISLDGADIKGDLVAGNGFNARGEVRGLGMIIGGQLNLGGASLSNPYGNALSLDGADIKGDMIAGNGFTAVGQVRALGMRVGGQLLLNTADLSNANGIALDLGGASIQEAVVAGDGFRATGEVRALGATFGALMFPDAAILSNPNGNALSLDGADIKGDMFAEDGFIATGEVRALGMTVGGQLSLTGATLHNPDSTALSLDRADIRGGLFAGDGFRVTGELRAPGLALGGQLRLDGASLSCPGGIALSLDGADIKDALMAGHGFSATGQVQAPNMTVSGPVILSGATLSNPGGDSLILDRADIKGDLFAGNGFSAEGTIRALGMTVGGQLGLTGATLNNALGTALDLEGADIKGGLQMRGISACRGLLDLTGCRMGEMAVDAPPSSPPALASAAGWQVRDFHGHLRHNPKAVIRWLDTSRRFTVSPWEEAARLYERNGQPADARRLRFAAAQRTAKHAPLLSRPLRWLYLLIVGYGYYPLIAALWLGLTVFVATTLTAANPDAFLPTAPGARPASTVSHGVTCPSDTAPLTAATDARCRTPGYPELKPFTYALAAVSPASAVAQPAWAPIAPGAAWLEVTLTALKLLGWLLTVLLLAGLTGLLRKG